jgi:cytoplasmic iron level regulating protein YaaA (DUF328/UPF0246 family)
VAPRLVVLLPPSQGKATGGRRSNASGVFGEALAEPRQQVRRAIEAFLTRATTRELEITLGARGPLLERSVFAMRSVASESAPKFAAWRRYQGVVWTHLDPESLAPEQRRRILVPSGVYGLISAEDPIADYRLKMNASIAPLGVIAKFWRPKLATLLSQRPVTTFLDLLPQEHAASVDFEELGTRHRVIRVRFVERDEQRAIGHDAKAVKGVVARHALTDGVDSLDGLEWQGWRITRDEDTVLVTAEGSHR